ncbi:DUF2125 domain-containing protein [Rubellimicrobium rubrum]|nr:DUF2125 domain-containing protein [Rubellimicrobium rubrum]
MRALFFVVALLAALYAGYWFIGSSQVETRAEAALAQLESRGWEVDYTDLSTQGFPSRFDTTVTDVHLGSPDGQVRWDAPFVQVFALSYRPNQVIAVWPPEQRLLVAGQPLTVISEGLRASGTAQLSPDLPLDHAAVESGPLSVTSEQGWSASLSRLLGAIREAGAAPATYDVFVETENLVSPAVPVGLDLLRLDAQVTLDQPLNRHVTGTPHPRSIALREARLTRGDVAISARGDLAPDAQGVLAGEVTVTVNNWPGLLDLLQELEFLPFDRRALFEGAFRSLAQGEDRIEVPVTFTNGKVEALGLVLLDAPRL